MRKTFVLVMAVALLGAALPALAELQNVTVGGEVRIRMNYIRNTISSTAPNLVDVRWPAGNVDWLPGRPIGLFPIGIVRQQLNLFDPGMGRNNGPGIVSLWAWDEGVSNLKFVEQRTRLNVQADFTDDVRAYIELDSYDIWGEDFRSNYIQGVDQITRTDDDLEVFQAYIEADNMFDLPLRLRIGRQELSFGKEWLVGTGDSGPLFTGISFDAVRLTYKLMDDTLTLDAWWSKLNEGLGLNAEEDGDVDFSGIYASYTGIENVVLDAYWMWLRDARMINDTNFIWIVEWLEDAFGIDDYNVTNLHTIGLRGEAKFGALDLNAEFAYQFGDASAVGAGFRPYLYGVDSPSYDSWATDIEVGYTLDVMWNPRVFLGFAYFGGEDNRDLSFWDWLNPFDMPDASVSFNRLFSNKKYSGFVDLWNDFSNGYLYRIGVQAHPTETLDAMLCITHFVALEEFDSPVYFTLGRYRIPVAPNLSFWTESNDEDLGTEVALFLTYHYSEDLLFQLGICHMFTDNGLGEGNYVAGNGLLFNGGTNDDDGTYVYLESRLKF